MKRLGKCFETEAKHYLKDKYQTELVFKLINPERIDFITIPANNQIILTEAKKTVKKVYYPKGCPRKREQLQHYFQTKKDLEAKGMLTQVTLLLNKRGQITYNVYNNYEEIPTRL